MSLIDEASLVQIPSGYKEDKLYSIIPSDGSGDFNFSRASTATRVNSEGLIEEVPCNLVEQSNTFNTTWQKQNSSVLSGQSGYDGTNNAWLFSWTSSTAFLYQPKNLNVASNTISVYAKQGTSSSIRLDFVTGSFVKGASCTFDLSSGTAGSIVHYGASSGFSATINSVGDGWYRISLTGTTSSETWYHELVLTSGNVYIQDAQLVSGSTAKPYFPTTDRLNVPRIDYTGGGCGSLLLEKQSTNLKLYSEQFDNGYWAKFDCSITANDTTSPDGTTNGDKIVGTAGTFAPVISRNSGATAGAAYTLSVFAKKGGYSFIYLKEGSVGNGTAWFDLENGVVGTKQNGITSSKITDYGQDWYRCEMTFNQSGTTNRTRIGVSNVDAVESFINNGTSGAYLYGAQFEQGSYATSYIPTSGSTVTRLADSASKTGISSLINDSEGTLFAEVKAFTNGGTSRRISIGDGSTGNRVSIEIDEDADTIKGFMSSGGTLVGSVVFIGIDQTDNLKIALTYTASAFSLFINGVKRDNDTSIAGTPIGLDRLFYSSAAGSLPFEGKCQNLMIFPTALTDTELETLTTL